MSPTVRALTSPADAPAALRYGLAVLLAVAAVALTAAAAEYLDRTNFILGFMAAGISAWYGGRRPGLMTAVLVIAGLHVVPIDAAWGTFELSPQRLLADALFIVGSTIVVLLTGSLREAHARESEARTRALALADRMSFLAAAGETLASPLDYDATLRQVARMAVPRFADWCAVDLIDDRGELRRVVVEHVDPARVELAHELARRYPPDLEADRGLGRVLRTGEPLHIPFLSDAVLREYTIDDEHFALAQRLGLRSAVVAPLVARERVLGALTFVTGEESGRSIDEADAALATDLARRAALAIDAAITLRELRESRLQVEETATQLEEQASELEQQNEELQQTMEELEQATLAAQEANEGLERVARDAEAARAEAEHANRAKSEFLAAMSHELRTPLNAIAGYSELLTTGVYGPVTAEQIAALDRVKRNQKHLLALINNILNFAKLEAGKVETRVEAVPLDDTIAGLHALIEPQLTAKQLRYLFEPCGARGIVLADREKLEQIVLNLLSNAVKFTPDGGVITVRCARDGTHCRVEVQDTGRGVPADRVATIFDPFVQLEAVHTREAGGVGLGLSISRDLARLMGGDITVSSRPGAGSTFTLSLPRASLAAGGTPSDTST